MPPIPLLKAAFGALGGVVAAYFIFLALLCHTEIQRFALYAHKVNTIWWTDPAKPITFGFLNNQVRQFTLNTSDGLLLYGWHILPIDLYGAHEAELSAETVDLDSYKSSLAFKLLRDSKHSRVVVSFHGNMGTVVQGWRTDNYRAIAAADPQNLHVLTIDYRGFGYSEGFPSEPGLITDGISLVDMVLSDCAISPDRIIVQGQSLGTAVATAVVEHFASLRKIDFKGLVLLSAYTNIPSLMRDYRIAGLMPVLSPLTAYPALQEWLSQLINEHWHTDHRLERFIRSSQRTDIRLIHARDDRDVAWRYTDQLFYIAANATGDAPLSKKHIDAAKFHQKKDQGGFSNVWKAGQATGLSKYIREDIMPRGGHNRLMTYSVVTKAVLDVFGGRQSTL